MKTTVRVRVKVRGKNGGRDRLNYRWGERSRRRTGEIYAGHFADAKGTFALRTGEWQRLQDVPSFVFIGQVSVYVNACNRAEGWAWWGKGG